MARRVVASVTRAPDNTVTVVVPVHDNAPTLAELHRRVTALRRADRSIRLLFVDDASDDDSWPVIAALAAHDEATHGLRLAGHAGQVAAAMLGMALARTPVIVTIDADLETAPEDIPVLLAAVDAGHDFVNGWRRRRHASRRRRVASSLFNGLGRLVTREPIRDLGSGFTAMTQPVAEAMIERVRARPHQMVKPVFFAVAASPVEVEVVHPGAVSASGYRGRDLARFAAQFWREYGPLPSGRRQPLPPPDVGERTPGAPVGRPWP
jgi:hypothetical protein